MKDLSEQEYDALENYFVNSDPKVGPNGSGYVSKWKTRQWGLDDLSLDYLVTKSLFLRKSVPQIMNDIIHEKILANA